MINITLGDKKVYYPHNHGPRHAQIGDMDELYKRAIR